MLKVLISDGRYTRLFGAMDEVEGGEVALKFPKPQVATAATYHAAFVREAWVGARVNSPWIGRIIELPPGRQTCLYTVMPLYQGELLSTRLARRPSVGLEEGRNIAIKLARGVAALHRAGIIHRDIKPDNIILESEGSLKLIDLGVVRVPGLEDFPPEDIPGTMAYMAPEMLAGEPGNEATDVYALGVTMFRTFTGEFPYGNLDALSQPRRGRATPLAELRPDLPAWLQVALGRAIATDPAERFRDVMEIGGNILRGQADRLRESWHVLNVGGATHAEAWLTKVLVLLVDTPGVTSEAVRRVAAKGARDSLATATYGPRRGHPVRAHLGGPAAPQATSTRARPPPRTRTTTAPSGLPDALKGEDQPVSYEATCCRLEASPR